MVNLCCCCCCFCSRGILPLVAKQQRPGEEGGRVQEEGASGVGAEKAKAEDSQRALRKKRAAENKVAQGPPKSEKQ